MRSPKSIACHWTSVQRVHEMSKKSLVSRSGMSLCHLPLSGTMNETGPSWQRPSMTESAWLHSSNLAGVYTRSPFRELSCLRSPLRRRSVSVEPRYSPEMSQQMQHGLWRVLLQTICREDQRYHRPAWGKGPMSAYSIQPILETWGC